MGRKRILRCQKGLLRGPIIHTTTSQTLVHHLPFPANTAVKGNDKLGVPKKQGGASKAFLPLYNLRI